MVARSRPALTRHQRRTQGQGHRSAFLAYLARRAALLVICLLVASVVLFLLLRLLPGSPVAALISVGQTPEQIQQAEHQLGLDKPLIVQLGEFIKNLFAFHFGTSFITQLDVAPQIGHRAAVTLPLTFLSFLLALIISVPVGFIAAVKSDRPFGLAVSSVSQLGVAIPVFWLGEILVIIFALQWHLFPSGGFPVDGWSSPGQALYSLALPIITIALAMSAMLVRYVRSAALDVLGSDYLRTCRSLGFSLRYAIFHHGLRNASIPVISILGIQLATTLLGAVVIEEVYNLPGWGELLVSSIVGQDFPTILGVLVASTFLILLIGFAADITQHALDPRLRGASEKRKV